MSGTVLVVDDDEGFRKLVKRILQRDRQTRRVVEATNGEEAVRLSRELQPEIILMDVAMPKMDGLEATRRVKAFRPEARVIMLTIHNEEAYRRAATECGADGYVLKKTLTADLHSAMAGCRTF